MENGQVSIRRILFVISIMLLSAVPQAVFAQSPAAEKHTVKADGHPLAVWSKVPDQRNRVVILLHGRTSSTLPDFDLQVPGEALSRMDALYERGDAVYGLDLRGYRGTPRDERCGDRPAVVD